MKQLSFKKIFLILMPFVSKGALYSPYNTSIAQEISEKAQSLKNDFEGPRAAALKMLAAACIDHKTIRGQLGLFCFSKIIEMQNCYLITESEAPLFHQTVAELCAKMGVAKPILCIVPDQIACGAQRIPGFPAIFCLGKPFAEKMDAESLNAIIAHEIGHITLHHGETQIFFGMGMNISLIPSGLHLMKGLLTNSWPNCALQAIQLLSTYGATYLAFMKYSRATEVSADRVAAQLYGKEKVINALEQSKKLLHIDETEEFENEEPNSDNHESHTSALIVTIQPVPEKWHSKLWTWVKKLTHDHPSYDDRIETLKSSDK